MKPNQSQVSSPASPTPLTDRALVEINGGDHRPSSGQQTRTTPLGVEHVQWTPTSYQWTLTTSTGMQHYVWTPTSAQYSNAQAGAVTPCGPVAPVHHGWTATFG